MNPIATLHVRSSGQGPDFIAPDLILAEFANVAWKRLSRREISEAQATAMVDHLPYVLRYRALLSAAPTGLEHSDST